MFNTQALIIDVSDKVAIQEISGNIALVVAAAVIAVTILAILASRSNDDLESTPISSRINIYMVSVVVILGVVASIVSSLAAGSVDRIESRTQSNISYASLEKYGIEIADPLQTGSIRDGKFEVNNAPQKAYADIGENLDVSLDVIDGEIFLTHMGLEVEDPNGAR